MVAKPDKLELFLKILSQAVAPGECFQLLFPYLGPEKKMPSSHSGFLVTTSFLNEILISDIS